MTLIIAAANDKYAVLTSDRRLTLPGGQVVDEEACKLTVFACKDAKVMIAYTGIATTGKARTEDWIIDSLSEASENDCSIYEVIENFKNIANSQVSEISANINGEFRLELVFVGFYFFESKTHPKVWRISNLYNGLEFVVYSAGSVDDKAFIELGGTTRGVTEKDRREIKSLLFENKPVHGVEMKLVNTVKKASRNKKSLGKVGKQINSCCLSSDLNAPFMATYHSNVTQNVMYSVNSVLAISGGRASVMKDGILTAGPEWPPVSLPKANPSQLCPCGSGMKYKHCHSKIAYPYLPLSHENEITKGSQDSGTKFIVRTYGAYGGG